MIAIYTGKKFDKDTESSDLLKKYLKGAVEMTHKSSILQAYSQINDWADKIPFKDLEKIEKKDLDARYKQLEAEKKRYGLKQKAAYFANALAGDHGEEVMLKVGAVFTMVSVATALPPEMFHTAAALGAAYFGSKMAAHVVGDPDNTVEKMSARAYISIKHEQLALRQLAKRLESPTLNVARGAKEAAQANPPPRPPVKRRQAER